MHDPVQETGHFSRHCNDDGFLAVGKNLVNLGFYHCSPIVDMFSYIFVYGLSISTLHN